MKISVITTVSSFVGFVASITGIISFLLNNPIITVICAVVTLVDSGIQIFIGDQNSFITEILTVLIGAIIGLITKIGIFSGIAVALCFVCAFMTLLGWGIQLYSFIRFIKKKDSFYNINGQPMMSTAVTNTPRINGRRSSDSTGQAQEGARGRLHRGLATGRTVWSHRGFYTSGGVHISVRRTAFGIIFVVTIVGS